MVNEAMFASWTAASQSDDWTKPALNSATVIISYMCQRFSATQTSGLLCLEYFLVGTCVDIGTNMNTWGNIQDKIYNKEFGAD